jgi:hypothetical protein
MKKLLVLAVCLIGYISDSSAQSNKEDIDIIQSVYGKDKKTLVEAYMAIPQAKTTAFWKLYDEYEDKRKALGRKKITILEQYAENYDKLDNAKALQLAQSAISNNMEMDKLHATYLQKFGTVVGGKDAAKLFQLENYLNTMIKMELLDHIPFIGELDKTKIKN